jgi:glycosyltransferase involved in cell wall biosynthesis
MKILMLTQSYRPIVGGEERIVEDLASELTDRGHDVAIATLGQPGAKKPEDSGGVRVHALRSSASRLPVKHRDSERRHAPPAPDPETVIDLRRVLKQEQPDLVHAHNWLVHSYLPLHHTSGAALVLTLHDYGLLCATKRLFYRGAPCSGPGLEKCIGCAAEHYGTPKGVPVALATLGAQSYVRRQVDMFLPISEAVRELCRLGPEDPNRVVPDFIRSLPEPPEDTDPRLRQLPDEPFILYFGDVTEDKGGRYLGDAYATLAKPPPLVMIGRCFLEELRERPGIRPLGVWPHEVAIAALRRSMFSVAPSIWPEPFGLVALEAAAAEKPVVASDIGGLKDIVAPEETGLLVAPGDRDALGAAMQRLIEDPELRTRMGKAAGQRAGLFSADVVLPQIEDAYRSAISTRRYRRHLH